MHLRTRIPNLDVSQMPDEQHILRRANCISDACASISTCKPMSRSVSHYHRFHPHVEEADDFCCIESLWLSIPQHCIKRCEYNLKFPLTLYYIAETGSRQQGTMTNIQAKPRRVDNFYVSYTAVCRITFGRAQISKLVSLVALD